MALIDKVRMALRITTTAYDEEIADLIEEAYTDLDLVGIQTVDAENPAITKAVKTYCRLNFGSPDDYDRLLEAYKQQKAQLMVADDFTDYSMLEEGTDGGQIADPDTCKPDV